MTIKFKRRKKRKDVSTVSMLMNVGPPIGHPPTTIYEIRFLANAIYDCHVDYSKQIRRILKVFKDSFRTVIRHLLELVKVNYQV